MAEVLERADGDNPVDGLVELFPALQKHPLGARTGRLGKELFDMGPLVFAQRQADDVDVVLLDRAHHRRTPATADVEQRHAGLQPQFAERQVDLGPLGLFEGHVVALEVGAAVGLRGVKEQREELVGQVVVRLHVFEVGLQAIGVLRRLWHRNSVRFPDAAKKCPGRCHVRRTARRLRVAGGPSPG